METIYRDIAERTGGNIYIGVVGPVRTGKSTLIKRMMEMLVIPAIEDPARAARAKDELPQSGSGKTIMTSEPKFVPEEAVEILPDGATRLRIRMIDSVGYMVDGAVGAQEDGVPRMVSTPWSDAPIPLTEAAQLGTKKVMDDHASIGILVTTDGTVTDIPRSDYLEAERRSLEDIRATGKPFLTIINTRDPMGPAALNLRERLKAEFGIDAAIADCLSLDKEGCAALLQDLLYAFPLEELRVSLPRWTDALEPDAPLRLALNRALLEAAGRIHTLGQAREVLEALPELPEIRHAALERIDLAKGAVHCRLTLPEQLYYDTLSRKTGVPITGDAQLMQLLTELCAAKKAYDRVAEALNAAESTGYGVVMPDPGQMTLQKPELAKKGSVYGIRLKAAAPSIHMIRVDLDTEINPMVGSEQQSKELVEQLGAHDSQSLWESNIFGKSVSDLVRDSLDAKMLHAPEEVRHKFRGSLSKIVNEGAQGLIYIIV